jgi:SAM-dependent methyltransferase
MSTSELDQTRAEAFGNRMFEILNHGAIALMISVGHRTGLFDTMATMQPAGSAEIADAASLNERYVREWLGAVVTGGIVEYNSADKTYWLPSEHAASLTRAAAPNNIAAFMQYIPELGSVQDGIVKVFQAGGGVPYEDFPHFHDLMAEDSGQSVVPALFDHILPLVPGLPAALQQGIDVLDLGCGQGRALLLMARAFPNSRFTGYDFAATAIAAARAEAERLGLANIRFEVRDAAALDEVERYDQIFTFDAIHDQKDPAAVLANIARALKPDGVYLMQDIRASAHLEKNMDHPAGPFLYAISTMHCMTVSLAYGGAGLGTMWGVETALAMLAEAGFMSVEVEQLAHDFQNNYYIVRKS